ncbi:Holliday junction resolvase RuvX [Schaalia sp. lx-100]|uniref:Holliday junction resolvase RuvX n=1 Tax=Schaalia sp. lx-100 TaxID=2899081 RepID=UPI001E523A5F|nr:Holliday junction resolvase RuvX [Schaalia sp. lx-100]
MAFRRGTRLGVDVGTVRIGLARTDPEAIMTFPLETLHRADDGSEFERLISLVEEYDVMEIIVGLPRHLAGGEGISAKGARRYARRIKKSLPHIRVAFVDERLTSHQAHQRLRAAGRCERSHREIVDQVAAQIILEHALEIERMSGNPPGDVLESPEQKGKGTL